MKTYLIGYDLNKAGQDYSKLIARIKELFPTFWHHLDSTWIVRTTASSTEIRDDLMGYIDTNDELLVARLSDEAAWYGFKKSGSDWLINQLV